MKSQSQKCQQQLEQAYNKYNKEQRTYQEQHASLHRILLLQILS